MTNIIYIVLGVILGAIAAGFVVWFIVKKSGGKTKDDQPGSYTKPNQQPN